MSTNPKYSPTCSITAVGMAGTTMVTPTHRPHQPLHRKILPRCRRCTLKMDGSRNCSIYSNRTYSAETPKHPFNPRVTRNHRLGQRHLLHNFGISRIHYEKWNSSQLVTTIPPHYKQTSRMSCSNPEKCFEKGADQEHRC